MCSLVCDISEKCNDLYGRHVGWLRLFLQLLRQELKAALKVLSGQTDRNSGSTEIASSGRKLSSSRPHNSKVAVGKIKWMWKIVGREVVVENQLYCFRFFFSKAAVKNKKSEHSEICWLFVGSGSIWCLISRHQVIDIIASIYWMYFLLTNTALPCDSWWTIKLPCFMFCLIDKDRNIYLYKPGKNRQNRTGTTGQAGQDMQNRTGRTGQEE